MSLSRAVVATAMLASAPATARVECPVSHHGHALDQIGMFDGPPSEQAELVGDANGWDTELKAGITEPAMFVLCRYKGTTETVTVPVPVSIKRCDLPAHGYIRIVCH